MILHIPHASTDTLEYKINNKKRELLRMTDWYSDDLYAHERATRIVFEVSRLICDVERFEDDSQEPMSQYGMGVCYTTDTQGETLRDFSTSQREDIIKHYYRPHHQRLSDAVDVELEKEERPLYLKG